MKERLWSLVIAMAVAGLVVGGVVSSGLAAQPDTASANAAIGYIKAHQNPDGGFPAFGTDSSPGSTVDAVFAIVSTNGNPGAVTNGGKSPLDYLETQAAGVGADPGAAAKLALGVSVSGLHPGAFAGLDLFTIMDGFFDPGTGVYGVDLFDEALYVLALSASDRPVPSAILNHLKSVQLQDGSWEFGAGFGGDTNTTALVMQALIGGGTPPGDTSIQNALGYLAGAQNSDGGFGFTPGSESDPSSTAFVIQALVAAREDIDAGGPWPPGGVSPLDALKSQQNPLTGAFQFAGEDSIFSTYQAVPGVMLAPFPTLETMSDGAQPASPTATPTTAAATPQTSVTPAPTTLAAVAPPAVPAQLPASGGRATGGGIATAMILLTVTAGMTTIGMAGISLRRKG